MLTYPGARWKPLGAQTQNAMRAHDIFCYHTMAGYLVSTDGYFRIGNGEGYRGTESHYGVGGKWGPDLGGAYGNLDGACWQWQDRRYTADANLDGNWHVISCETADNAVRPIQEWTPAQLDRLVDVGAWECSLAAHAECPAGWTCRGGVLWNGIRVAIPPVLIPDTHSDRRGIAYHAQGCPPGIDGEAWSQSYGKDCPTAVRIQQLINIVIPRIQGRLRGNDQEDDDMPYSRDELAEIFRSVLNEGKRYGTAGEDAWARTHSAMATNVGDIFNRTRATQAMITLLAAGEPAGAPIDDGKLLIVGADDRPERYLLTGDRLEHIPNDAIRADLMASDAAELRMVAPASLDWLVSTLSAPAA